MRGRWVFGWVIKEQFVFVRFVDNRLHFAAELGKELDPECFVFDGDRKRHDAPYFTGVTSLDKRMGNIRTFPRRITA